MEAEPWVTGRTLRGTPTLSTYGLPELGWIIELVAYDVSVNVVFLSGADFESPPPLGDIDRSRYVKVMSVEDVQRREMRDWVKQAGRVQGWK